MDIAWLQLSFIFPLKLQLATDHVKQLNYLFDCQYLAPDTGSLFFVYSSAKNGPLHFSPLFTNTDQFMLNAKF